MPIRVTVDSNCINARGGVIGMPVLERWEREGKVRLCAAQRLLEEMKGHPLPKARTKAASMEPISEPGIWGSASIDGDRLGSRWGQALWTSASIPRPSYESVCAVMFSEKPLPLSTNDNVDVMHLMAHIHADAEYFISNDRPAFVGEGTPEKLRAALGVEVSTPEDLVERLRAEHEWP